MAGEAKRKHPDVRAACEEAIESLNSIARGQAGAVARTYSFILLCSQDTASPHARILTPLTATEALQGQAVLKPLLLACAAKHVRVCVCVVTTLHDTSQPRPPPSHWPNYLHRPN